MKRCPYCAEEIQEAAVICRYCHRRVGGLWRRRIIFLMIISVIGISVFTQKSRLRDFKYRMQSVFYQLDNFWESVKETVRDMKNGLGALKSYNYQFDMTERKVKGGE